MTSSKKHVFVYRCIYRCFFVMITKMKISSSWFKKKSQSFDLIVNWEIKTKYRKLTLRKGEALFHTCREMIRIRRAAQKLRLVLTGKWIQTRKDTTRERLQMSKSNSASSADNWWSGNCHNTIHIAVWKIHLAYIKPGQGWTGKPPS